jgi:hypothetical protein
MHTPDQLLTAAQAAGIDCIAVAELSYVAYRFDGLLPGMSTVIVPLSKRIVEHEGLDAAMRAARSLIDEAPRVDPS